MEVGVVGCKELGSDFRALQQLAFLSPSAEVCTCLLDVAFLSLLLCCEGCDSEKRRRERERSSYSAWLTARLCIQ